MEKLCCVIVIVCVSLFAISSAMASDNQDLETQGGVEVIVKYYPLGPNNLIVAFVNFVNNNAYKVHVNWKPIITCEGSDMRKGYGEPFVMSEGGSYQVTIWRSQACGDRKLENIRVEMEVKDNR
jgi:hypothetical protein